jgi:hypothetical protein
MMMLDSELKRWVARAALSITAIKRRGGKRRCRPVPILQYCTQALHLIANDPKQTNGQGIRSVKSHRPWAASKRSNEKSAVNGLETDPDMQATGRDLKTDPNGMVLPVGLHYVPVGLQKLLVQFEVEVKIFRRY